MASERTWNRGDGDMADKSLLDVPTPGAEREAFVELEPAGFYIRQPPKPDRLNSFITADDDLFQTIHMGAAVVDNDSERPFALNLHILHSLPSHTITSTHECFGSPLKPTTTALWRVGNAQWTGVRLNTLLQQARPLPEARYVWSEGLDRGEFFEAKTDRYQKDLPISKAWGDEVLLTYAMNGALLSKERGGPVRLVVPGWFGTNATKWISRISLQTDRAPGPFTTIYYNTLDPKTGAMKPVWQADVNSMIVRPAPEARVASSVSGEGWAWDHDGIGRCI